MRASVTLIAGLLCAIGMWAIAGTPLLQAAAALAIVYVLGYVSGALLIAPNHQTDTLALAVVRLVSGLLLTAIGFLLSLVLSVPWFTGPAAIFLIAVLVRRQAAFRPPRLELTLTWDGAAAAAIAAIVATPVILGSLRMAPGGFPPVFFNVDTPYFLEKVHALVRTNIYPPESLGVLGGRMAYHFGTQGIAALISRATGMAPHHALFLIVLPLLTLGVVAAAVVLAGSFRADFRLKAEATGSTVAAVPYAIAIPMLLTATPTLWHPFWQTLGPSVWEAMSLRSSEPLQVLAQNYELWGAVTNNGQNLATAFLTLAALAGIAAAPVHGWLLPVFLIGSAVIFKAPTGVALAAGFSVAQLYRAATGRTLRPLIPVAGVVIVFAAVYGAFWIAPRLPVEYKTELFPFFYVKYLAERERVSWFIADFVWLALPALILLPITPLDRRARRMPLLLIAITPVIVVNALRAVDLRPGFGVDQNWPQVLMPVPLLMHAFVLSVAAARWARLGIATRTAFVALVIVTVVPPLWVSARYTQVLVSQPEAGHEFVDNRPIAAALRTIPVSHSLIVTNDLRYPAEGFDRPMRQMQIPALFGHQAFAVNYIYESYSFSRDRLGLQKLLQSEAWTDEIAQAARVNGWTHLLVRKDYVHPATIPLEQVFDSELYSVYRFQ